MKLIDNVSETLKDDIQGILTSDTKVTVAAACFSMYAYNELRKELGDVEGFRFIFTEPTFITEKTEKEKREFLYTKNRKRE